MAKKPKRPKTPDADPKKEEDVEIGLRLAIIRMALGMEQKELAGHIGETAQALSNWENGEAKLPVRKLNDIFRVTGVDANYLYMAREDSLPERIRLNLAAAREAAMAPGPRRISRNRP